MKSWYWRRNALEARFLLGSRRACWVPGFGAGRRPRTRSGLGRDRRRSCCGNGRPRPCHTRKDVPDGCRRARSAATASLRDDPLVCFTPPHSRHGRIITRSVRSNGGRGTVQRQWSESPTLIDTTTTPIARAIRPSTSDRRPSGTGSARGGVRGYPDEAGDQERGDASSAGSRDRKNERDRHDAGRSPRRPRAAPRPPPGSRGSGVPPTSSLAARLNANTCASARPTAVPQTTSTATHSLDCLLPRGDEFRREHQADVQGHRDGLANRLARGRTARPLPCSSFLAPRACSAHDAAVWRKRRRPPPREGRRPAARAS